jgi:hypothetical protein
MVRYQGDTPFEELEIPPPPPEVADARDWALNDPEVQKKYSGYLVLVHQRKVWGAGRSYSAALKQALQQPGCPPERELVFVFL